jgi:hypothetical protein
VTWHVMVSPLGQVIVHVVSWKRMVHPARVSGVTPTRLVLSCGKTSTWPASGGRPGSGRLAVWVEWMCCWLATVTVTGEVVGRVLGSGVSMEK